MCPYLWTNANEGDLMVWLHCIHSHGRRILIFSRDTDVYHNIGLTIASIIPEKHIIVQLSKQITKDPKFIDLNGLIRCLAEDPDLQLSISPRHYSHCMCVLGVTGLHIILCRHGQIEFPVYILPIWEFHCRWDRSYR